MESYEFDPQNVDVIAMTRETGISIFNIYDALGLAQDPITDLVSDQLEGAGSFEEWLQALQDKCNYMRGVAGKPQDVKGEVISPDSEEGRRLQKLVEEGGGVKLEHLLSAMMQQQSAEDGVPWDTDVQADRIREELLATDSVEESVRIYRTIPLAAQERNLAIQIISRLFPLKK